MLELLAESMDIDTVKDTNCILLLALTMGK